MRYRAFIAATKQDLERQRKQVTKKLRDAGVEIDPMENWPADGEHPAKLSATRTAGCHFCIALIAYQRGTVANNDPQGRSITQIEIQETARKGAKVLVYLLRDSTENHQKWPTELNHLDDEKVHGWRQELQREFTCEYFDADTMPDVLPAVTRQIIAWENRRHRKLLLIIAMLVGGILSIFISLQLSVGLRQWTLSRFLAWNDATVFQQSRDSQYKVARLLEGRSDLQDNANFREELKDAQTSFAMYANTFGAFRDYQQDFDELAKRGVQLRFIVTDFSADNRSNWEPFLSATSEKNLDETLAEADNICKLIRDVQKKHPGKIELRLNRKPIFYTLWLRDPDSETGLGHLGVHYYAGKSNWPCFRISKRTGGNQLQALQEQFDVVWDAATPDSE